jgi:hypothetical protein
MFNFQDEQQQQCPVCSVVDEYVSIALTTNSREELFEVLHDLYEKAYADGIVAEIERDMNAKQRLLEAIYDECDCDECDC